jgi:hypothetical protein
MFYVLAAPYRLAGSNSVGLLLGAVVVNVASIVGMALIARRRGGTPAFLCALVACALLVRTLGFEFLDTPWNPYLTVLPYGVMVLLTWAMLCGDRWALPVATAVATFLAQTHVGNVVLAVPLLAAGFVGLVLAQRRAGRSARELLRVTLLSAAVGAIAWLPPVIDQVTNSPGNLRNIVGWFRSSGAETHSLLEGWRVVSAQYWISPEWATGERAALFGSTELNERLAPLLLVPLVVAAVAAWRRPSASGERRLLVVWLVASVCGVVSVARTVGAVYAYRLYWAWVLGAVAAMAVGWIAWTALERRWESVGRRLLVPVALALLAVLAVVNSAAAVDAGRPQQEESDAIAALMPAVLESLPPGEGEVELSGSSLLGIGYMNGLRLALEQHGVPAHGSGEVDDQGGVPVRARLYVAVGTDLTSLAATSPQWELVAYSGAESIDEVAERRDEMQDVLARYERGEIDYEEGLEELAALRATGSFVAVFRERPRS